MTLACAADLALASASPPGGAGGGPAGFITSLLPMIAIFAIFYFLMIRPQQRQKGERQRMLDALKRGDRVVTTSGLHGTVTNLNEQTVVLRVADQVKLEFDRSAVARIVVGEGQGGKDA